MTKENGVMDYHIICTSCGLSAYDFGYNNDIEEFIKWHKGTHASEYMTNLSKEGHIVVYKNVREEGVYKMSEEDKKQLEWFNKQNELVKNEVS